MSTFDSCEQLQCFAAQLPDPVLERILDRTDQSTSSVFISVIDNLFHSALRTWEKEHRAFEELLA